MKSEALKTAWKLFRKYEMTFSQALVEGWKKAKKAFLKSEFEKTSYEEQTYRQRLVNRFKSLTEIHYNTRGHVFYSIAKNMNGAIHDYGNGIYNGD